MSAGSVRSSDGLKDKLLGPRRSPGGLLTALIGIAAVIVVVVIVVHVFWLIVVGAVLLGVGYAVGKRRIRRP